MRENFDWLKDLKPGDEVAVDRSSHWNRNYYTIEKVEKITPTGRIKLSDNSQYQSDGKRIGEAYCYPLRQVTSEILELIERRELFYKLRFDDFKGLLSVERLKILLEWQKEFEFNMSCKSELSKLKVGDKVKHYKYGEGTVLGNYHQRLDGNYYWHIGYINGTFGYNREISLEKLS